MFAAFQWIYLLCFFNLMFFIAQLLQMVFLKKLERVFAFPTIGFFSDLILFLISIFTIDWIGNNIFSGLGGAEPGSDGLFYLRMANFQQIVDYKFEYLLSVMISCLILKVLDLI